MIINVAMPMSLISALAVSTFVLPQPEKLPEALNMSVTVLLTAVAFKFVTAAYLPQIAYVTLIDKFVLWCTSIIYLATLFHAITGAMHRFPILGASEELIDTSGTIFFFICAALWTATQVGFGVAAWQRSPAASDEGMARSAIRNFRRESLRMAKLTESLRRVTPDSGSLPHALHVPN